MKKGLKKLFTDDSFFHAILILSVIGTIWVTFISLLHVEYLTANIMVLLIVACQITLYVSYIKHSKNVMKGMMGALLMGLLLSEITATSYGTDITAIMMLILSIAFMLNHLVINSDHASSPNMVLINQIIALLLAITNLVSDMLCLSSCATGGEVVTLLMGTIGYTGLVLFLVCVESRLDAYRTDREEAGWTEEKGYPEGYVHQYEKDQQVK